MNHIFKLAVIPLLAASLPAQGTVDTLGGTSSAPSRAALAKANVIKVDKTVMILKHEWYLGITGAETLTFFRYRHHSQKGAYVKDWTKTVKVNGTGRAWYSAGPIALPMVAGNHYLMGVSWGGTVTYHYNIGTTGQKISFGSWYSGRTPTGLPPTVTMGGVDAAQYYQRFSSVPLGKVLPVGMPCAKKTTPRLVAAAIASPGTKLILDLVDAAGTAPAVFVWAPSATLPKPIPLFGCSLWVNPLKGPVFTLGAATNAAGTLNLTVPIPQIKGLSGLKLSWQTLVVSPGNLVFTNAVELTL